MRYYVRARNAGEYMFRQWLVVDRMRGGAIGHHETYGAAVRECDALNRRGY